MSPEQNQKSVEISRLLLGYILGFFAWLAGFHCMEVDSNGNARLSYPKFAKYFLV